MHAEGLYPIQLIRVMGEILSLQDSKDPLEQLYGNTILKNFPNYERFWVKFIGDPKAERSEPYEYVFPSNMETEKESIVKEYERIQMVHYSLFCHLAGAHFQLRELENALDIKDRMEKHFRHWEHFEVGYVHLGSVFYMLESLWRIVLKLNKYPSDFRHIDAYLKLKGKDGLISRIEEVKTSLTIRRDQAVHYGRMFAWSDTDRFYVPLKVHRDMKWSNGNKITGWIPTDTILGDDILETEKLINALHGILIGEYEDFIIKKGIEIKSGKKE